LPPQAPSPIQAIQENVELEQLQVEDWEDETIKKLTGSIKSRSYHEKADGSSVCRSQKATYQ
jgi:hypothetical protein